jgi:hypothetical protein
MTLKLLTHITEGMAEGEAAESSTDMYRKQAFCINIWRRCSLWCFWRWENQGKRTAKTNFANNDLSGYSPSLEMFSLLKCSLLIDLLFDVSGLGSYLEHNMKILYWWPRREGGKLKRRSRMYIKGLAKLMINILWIKSHLYCASSLNVWRAFLIYLHCLFYRVIARGSSQHIFL